MADDPSASLPNRSGPPARPRPLDGEVMPPVVRMKPSDSNVPPRAQAASFKLRLSTALAAGAVALVLCIGLAGGVYVFATHGAPAPDRTATALDQLRDDMGHLKSGVDTLRSNGELAKQDEAVRALKKSVDTLKAELDGLRANNTAALAQLSSKLDKPDHDPAPKLTEIAARLDRIEKQVSSPVPTGSIAAPARAAPAAAPQTIAAQSVDKPLPRPLTLGNWILRDVYDGIALVEAREGGIREVAPGEVLPGAGEVRSIQRRGRAWVVVTSRGIIDNATW